MSLKTVDCIQDFGDINAGQTATTSTDMVVFGAVTVSVKYAEKSNHFEVKEIKPKKTKAKE